MDGSSTPPVPDKATPEAQVQAEPAQLVKDPTYYYGWDQNQMMMQQHLMWFSMHQASMQQQASTQQGSTSQHVALLLDMLSRNEKEREQLNKSVKEATARAKKEKARAEEAEARAKEAEEKNKTMEKKIEMLDIMKNLMKPIKNKPSSPVSRTTDSIENGMVLPLPIRSISYGDVCINSSGKATFPAEEVAAPAEEVAAPAEEVVAQEEVVPQEEVAPSEEVVAPSEEVVAPSEEVVAAEEKVYAAEEKVSAAEEKVSDFNQSWADMEENNSKDGDGSSWDDFGDEIDGQGWNDDPQVKKKEAECKAIEEQLALLKSAIENGTEEDLQDFAPHLEKIQEQQAKEKFKKVRPKARSSSVRDIYNSLSEGECREHDNKLKFSRICNICNGEHHAHDCSFRSICCEMTNGKNLHGIMEKCRHGSNCSRKGFGCVFNHCPIARPSRLELKRYVLSHISEFTSVQYRITKRDVIKAVKGDDLMSGEVSLN